MPYRNVHRNAAPIIHTLARHIYTTTRLSASHIWIGRGWDPKSVEHGTGRALDVIISSRVGALPNASQRANGDKVAAWLVKHAKQMRIRHIIWRMRIYRTRYGTWGPLPGRSSKSSVSDRHDDHIHIFLDNTSGSVPSDPVIPGGSVTLPGLPSSGVSGWDGRSFPGVAVFVPNRRSDAVKLLQQRLHAHGYSVGKAGIDGWFGADTRAAVKAFQQAQGWTGSDADGIPGPVTWLRLMEAKPSPSTATVSLSGLRNAALSDPQKPDQSTTNWAAVMPVEAALVREGYLRSSLADGHYGTATVRAYGAWQRSLGYRGKDADGIPGRSSLIALGGRHGFTVTS